MRRSRTIFVRLFLLACCGTAIPAHAWWNDEWAFRKEITLDGAALGAAAGDSASDVPVLIRLSLGNFSYFGDTQPDGADLRFIAGDDKTPLPFHIERYDAAAQLAYVWVKVPRIAAGPNQERIFLYYGNKTAPTASNAASTYDAAQVLLYHFGPGAEAAQDSTAYNTNPGAFSAGVTPAALIAAGARFDGGQSISVGPTPGLRFDPASGLSLSAWVRLDAAQAQAHVLELRDEGGEIVLGIDGAQAFARVRSADLAASAAQEASTLSMGEWHHLALRAAGGRLALFVDGEKVSDVEAAAAAIAGTLTIGSAALGGNFFSGDLDEVGVATTGRDDAWFKAAAVSQGMIAPLVVYGGDTQNEDGGGGESYFATTLRNVTIDGWVIIAVLGVMFFASLGIMAAKALFLNRVAQGNARFLSEFRRMSDDPAALERREGGKVSEAEESAFEEGSESQVMSALSDKGAFGVSTLWRLYHHGMRETMRRVEGAAVGADRVRNLSPQSIEAIRATMDASMTRMTQRLSSQMVWLTIAISGGPFLGLLGTVVGVMITFAAIAASGDVNINAIAPGIAAALVATVAGLGVAIPCLFGYNYLNTRVKELVADMRVFVDEFVTRVAEQYS